MKSHPIEVKIGTQTNLDVLMTILVLFLLYEEQFLSCGCFRCWVCDGGGKFDLYHVLQRDSRLLFDICCGIIPE